MHKDTDSNDGQEGPFSGLLDQAIDDAKNGRRPNEDFFGDDLFGRKVAKISRVHKLKHEDAEDVLAEIQTKILSGFGTFKPNDDLPFKGFFAWVRRIARNRYIDALRASRAEIDSIDDHTDDLKDDGIDLNKGIRQRELLKEFNRCVELMSTRERLAFTCIKVLELQSRVAAVILTAAGFPCTHTTALKWASDAWMRYFQDVEPSIDEIERKASTRASTHAKKASPKKQAVES